MTSGDYDNITTSYEFIDLDHVDPIEYKKTNFLTYFYIHRHSGHHGTSFMERPKLGEELDRYVSIQFK